MPRDFETDMSWQRRFIPQMKMVLAEHLIMEAPLEEDRNHATDLVVLTVESKRVGCRVRRNKYLERYPNQFTIRCDRPSGVETELDKVLRGFGDYLLYAFCDPAERELVAWTVCDLDEFRLWFSRECCRHGKAPGERVPNPDGTWFRAFELSALPPRFVVARHAAREAVAA